MLIISCQIIIIHISIKYAYVYVCVQTLVDYLMTNHVFITIVFIFIVISITFRSIRPPAFFRCLSNSGTFTGWSKHSSWSCWIPLVAWPGRDTSGELNHLVILSWCHMDYISFRFFFSSCRYISDPIPK